jgi:dCMP deaminase
LVCVVREMSKSDDLFFLGLAQYVAQRSKDPSTRVGAVIVRPDRTVASMGYNGFPRGVGDDPVRYRDRGTKYLMVVHAEQNALLTAREPLHGYTCYTTLHPCGNCAGAIIQSGIKRVVCFGAHNPRLVDSFRAARTMFKEAGVELAIYSGFDIIVEPEVAIEPDPPRILAHVDGIDILAPYPKDSRITPEIAREAVRQYLASAQSVKLDSSLVLPTSQLELFSA